MRSSSWRAALVGCRADQAERTGRQLGHAVELGRAGDDVRAGTQGSGPRPGREGKKWAERVREGREAAGLVPRLGQKGKKRSFSSKIPFLFLVFKSKFKCKPNANSIRVLNILFISKKSE